MLSGFPLYHFFHCGNPYSGAELGMRYLIEPAKKPDPADESGKKKLEFLEVTIWPEPWSVEHTAPEKQLHQEFEGGQSGLDAAVAWMNETYAADEKKWEVVPSILDCEPDC